MSNCKDTYKFICENLDENLNSPACVEIKKHLENCPKCKAYLNSLKATIRLYKAQKSPELKFSVSSRILKLIGSQKPQKKTQKN